MRAFRYVKIVTSKEVFVWTKWCCDDSKVFRLRMYIILTYLLTYLLHGIESFLRS